MHPKRSGNSGRYFRVRNWLSEYGLSSETCGRLWVFVTPKSASRKATGLELIDVPRSACNVSWPGPDVLFRATLLDQPLGQFGALPHRDHPAGDVAAEDIEDYVEVEVGPLGRPQQFGDVPTPELIGRGGQQFRLLVGRMGQLIAAFARFVSLLEQAIHGADRAVIFPFIEQRA